MSVGRAFLWIIPVLLGQMGYSQDQEKPSAGTYLGISAGFSPVTLGQSSFLFDAGARVLRVDNNQSFSLSYSRVFDFQLKFDSGAKDDDSKMDRLELTYGRMTCLSEGHKLFRHIFVGASVGISYNSIRYYKDMLSFDQGNAINVKKIGIPVGVTLTNSPGNSIFWGYEIKYHLISGGLSYPEFNVCASFNVN